VDAIRRYSAVRRIVAPIGPLHLRIPLVRDGWRLSGPEQPSRRDRKLAELVRHILNLAAQEWVDENGLTWLAVAPKITLLPDTQKRQPYPLNWDEQARLFKALPSHLAAMALFAVNTGCRDGEVCALRWEWEVKVPELGTSVFIVPGSFVKNGDERVVVLNRIASSVVEAQRPAPDARVRLWGQANRADADQRLEAGAHQGRSAEGAGP
jgi:integrase